ncbi:MAG: hypothetical protein JSV32_04465 [Dehalococcoidia bacterium]|nr:MAG: hypothetical protein JSV32_04465 [Dehalococcoidia bacterium]
MIKPKNTITSVAEQISKGLQSGSITTSAGKQTNLVELTLYWDQISNHTANLCLKLNFISLPFYYSPIPPFKINVRFGVKAATLMIKVLGGEITERYSLPYNTAKYLISKNEILPPEDSGHVSTGKSASSSTVEQGELCSFRFQAMEKQHLIGKVESRLCTVARRNGYFRAIAQLVVSEDDIFCDARLGAIKNPVKRLLYRLYLHQHVRRTIDFKQPIAWQVLTYDRQAEKWTNSS